MKAGWKEVGLGEICQFRYGKALKAEQRSGTGWPVYGSNGPVGRHGVALTDGPAVVIGRKGSYGEVHYSDGPAWPIDTTYYVDSGSTSCDLRWLSYRLAGLGLDELNRAAAVPGLNREDAYRRRLLLPPLGEQRRIAEVLDAVDDLRRKRQRAVELTATLVPASLTRIEGLNGEALPKVRLDELVARGHRINYGVVQPGSAVEAGVPLIRVNDLVSGRVRRDKIKLIDPRVEAAYGRSRIVGNEILVSCVGSVGLVAVTSEADIGSNVARAVARVPIDPPQLRTYIAAYLQTPQAQRYFVSHLRTVAQPTLNIAQIRALEIPVPSDRWLKRLYEAALHIDRIHQHQVEHLSMLDSLFESLRHRAFNGTV